MMHYDGPDGPMERDAFTPRRDLSWRGFGEARARHGYSATITGGPYSTAWYVLLSTTHLTIQGMPKGDMQLLVNLHLTNRSERRCHVPFKRQWRIFDEHQEPLPTIWTKRDEQRLKPPYRLHALFYNDEQGRALRLLRDGETAFVRLLFHVPRATEGYTLMFYSHFFEEIACEFDLPPEFYDAST
jgi:hypothetical protein